MDEKKDFLQETAEDVLQRLGVTAAAAISLEDARYLLNIEGNDLGALIGYHGEALSSLQLILSLAVYRHFGEWVPLNIDAGGYRREREDKLRSLTQRSIDKVRFLSRPVPLPAMPAQERRLVHLYAASAADIASESEGEGRERHVVLRLRSGDALAVEESGQKEATGGRGEEKGLLEEK